MRTAYFDCFAGVAGDMTLAALLDAGVELEALRAQVLRLGLPGVDLEATTVRRGGLRGTHVHVITPADEKKHRHLPQILKIIAAAQLSPHVTERATRIFQRLATAEAAVHGISADQVHFHEVGAADAIVDIVGACIGLELLKIERIICAPVPTGSGTVTCAHGVLPVPAPATAELLRGVPLAACDEAGELTTPTGAAIVTTLADSFGPLPALRIAAIGYGAGTRENRTRPNLLRLIIGERDAAPASGDEQIIVLETQLDDATGQTLGHTLGRLLAAGALDAYTVPIGMKKGRPGQLLAVLCRPADVAGLEDLLFRETTTFGVRRHACQRTVLERGFETVSTPFGAIRVKVGRRGGAVLQAGPEYDDCAAAAQQHGVPLRQVQDAARQAWNKQHDAGTERG
jgi:pyridinium-3,5-bisthiocarboxylic acid mononucleotide nickel chelatase